MIADAETRDHGAALATYSPSGAIVVAGARDGNTRE